MDEPRYEYDNFKVDPPKVDDGWYLVKGGMTYRVDVPIDMRFNKSINILTGEVHYPSNADFLRSMSDEELAEWLATVPMSYEDVCPNPIPKECNGGDRETCIQCWLDWLREETAE